MQRLEGARRAKRRLYRSTQEARFDTFVDSFAGRLVETSGDTLRRLRHNPNTGEAP